MKEKILPEPDAGITPQEPILDTAMRRLASGKYKPSQLVPWAPHTHAPSSAQTMDNGQPFVTILIFFSIVMTMLIMKF